jgi:DNA-directed RNA polymerase subunit RPC12/RpoP
MTLPASALPQPVVRACERCGQPAVIEVFAWNHTTWAQSTGLTRELRCQSCGADYKIHRPGHVTGLWIAGVIMTLGTCVGGLPVFWMAWRRSQIEKRIPVVAGAPVPQVRFPGGPPKRTCAGCASPLSAAKVTRNTHNGIPTGTEFEYLCAKCGNSFVIESAGGHVFAVASFALMGGITAAFLILATTRGWRFGGGTVAALLAAFLLIQTLKRFGSRLRNPVVPSM